MALLWSLHLLLLHQTTLRMAWQLIRTALVVPSPMIGRFHFTKNDEVSDTPPPPSAPRQTSWSPRIWILSEKTRSSGTGRFALPPLIRELTASGISVTDMCAALLAHLSRFAPLRFHRPHSGGKSLHGWFPYVGISEGERRDFMHYACECGAPTAFCWTVSQFVRVPDGTRYREPRPKPKKATCLLLRPGRRCPMLKTASSWNTGGISKSRPPAAAQLDRKINQKFSPYEPFFCGSPRGSYRPCRSPPICLCHLPPRTPFVHYHRLAQAQRRRVSPRRPTLGANQTIPPESFPAASKSGPLVLRRRPPSQQSPSLKPAPTCCAPCTLIWCAAREKTIARDSRFSRGCRFLERALPMFTRGTHLSLPTRRHAGRNR